MTSQLQCSGCDALIPLDTLHHFACPNRGQDDVDHVLRVQASELAANWPETTLGENDNAFLRYRKLSYSYQLAQAHGLSDTRYVELVESLCAAIAEVDRAPQVTPLVHSDALNAWVKNETVNVSGSHKARHLIGTAIHLAVIEELQGQRFDAPLAIASCGNAALAAAVVARAAKRRLQVFVPPSADANVIAKLDALGAERVTCERRAQDPHGDPCYLRFREAVAAGALPFSCQGGDNAMALVGGHTLGWELVEQSRNAELESIFVQVGGGALASSLMQAFSMAQHAGIIDHLPCFFAVQTENAHPLARAWSRFEDSGKELDYARRHRSEFMWPWESPPSSIAGGILDDETYDWFSVIEGLELSGGAALTVSEARLAEAQELAQTHTGIPVDHTGAAGFAGLLEARARSLVGTEPGSLVLFTGEIR